MSSQVSPVPRVPSLYAPSSNQSQPTSRNPTPSSLHTSASRSTLREQLPVPPRSAPQIYSPTASQAHIPLASSLHATLQPTASRLTLQIYHPTGLRPSSYYRHGHGFHPSTSYSSLQSSNPSTPNLLHPHSANDSRHSLWQSPSSSTNFTTSDIALADIFPPITPISRSFDVKNNTTSKISLYQPSTSPYIRSRRKRLRWLPDLDQMDETVLALSVTLTLAILVLIGVPLGAILPQRYVVPLPVNVIVPFYVYPYPGAWDRLFHAIIRNPDTNFTVILNIDHGPGASVWPPGEWTGPIKRLQLPDNVKIIGYVDTEGGKRSNATVRQDIATYAGWSKYGIGLHGIYFDRTPLQDVDNAKEYMSNISAAVRHDPGFNAPSVVVHGAGAVPNADMTSSHPNITVVFEGEYQDLPERKNMRRELKALGRSRENYAYIVHSVPAGVSRGGIRKIVDVVRRDSEWLFVTDQQGDKKYGNYSGRWEEFMGLIW